ncbi:hypothetical protein [Acidovorax sp. A1169]|uniref:hypothetical protein n=1 Tax=Acidovorax sp. A1169 TaxID=3059524 RepID=UPI002737B5F5|nr:hypothetical protein [Acidovorax sp. A1169]MDP4078316.1 hypothetical protein [Acidovorax sp. A1169]
MNELALLQGLGLQMPSPAYLIGSLVFSLIGWGVWRRGRKQTLPVLTWSGAVLMFYPYFVTRAWLLWGVGLALCAWVYLQWE